MAVEFYHDGAFFKENAAAVMICQYYQQTNVFRSIEPSPIIAEG